MVTRSSSREKVITVGVIEGFKKVFEMEGVSVNPAKLISDAKREGSVANYKSSWGQWASWCSKEKNDSFDANMKKILLIFLLTFLRRDYNIEE